MIFLVLLLAVLVVGMALAWVQEGGRTKRLTKEVAAVRADLERAVAAGDAAEARADTAAAERDDALERVTRAKRDAAEVARRLQTETEARNAAEASLASAEQFAAAAQEARERMVLDHDRLAADLATAQELTLEGSDDRVDEQWALALADIQRTWEVSVRPSPGMSSPLDGATDLFRVAVEVEVDAAREEAGALIELTWSGEDAVPPRLAVQALPLIRELVAQLSKRADEAELVVTAGMARVEIVVRARDEDDVEVVPDVVSDYQTAPGVFVLGG